MPIVTITADVEILSGALEGCNVVETWTCDATLAPRIGSVRKYRKWAYGPAKRVTIRAIDGCTMQRVGTARVVERGEVAVYLHNGEALVAAIDAPLDLDGRPLGLRLAPVGIEIAVAARETSHRLHGRVRDDGASSFKAA